jgi:hypothetical protein
MRKNHALVFAYQNVKLFVLISIGGFILAPPRQDRGQTMTILLLGGSPAAPSSTGRLLDHVGDKLAALGHRHSKLNVRDLPAKALLHADFADLRSSARGRRGRSGRHRDRHAYL